MRPCILLAAMVVAVVASGCDLHGDTHEAPLSARQCIDGWNAGTVSWATFGSGPWRATRQSGLVSPRLLVIAGSECRIAFALSGGRYLVVASSGVRQPSDTTSHGLQWSLSPGGTAAYGVANPVEAGLRLPSLVVTRACQEDTGTIRVSGCAPHNPAVQPLPVDAIQRRLVATGLRSTPFPYPRTPVYWLGATFHGLGARAVGHQAAASTIGLRSRRAHGCGGWTWSPPIQDNQHHTVIPRFAAYRAPAQHFCSRSRRPGAGCPFFRSQSQA